MDGNTWVFFAGAFVAYLCLLAKTRKEYNQMRDYLNYKDPVIDNSNVIPYPKNGLYANDENFVHVDNYQAVYVDENINA